MRNVRRRDEVTGKVVSKVFGAETAMLAARCFMLTHPYCLLYCLLYAFTANWFNKGQG